MQTDVTNRLSTLTRNGINDLAALLERRLGGSIRVGIGDASDFVQEAIRKVLAGDRSLRTGLTLEENLVAIARSLVWSEAKKSGVRADAVAERCDSGRERLGADVLWNLHVALEKVRDRLDPPATTPDGQVAADARAFVDALIDRLDRRDSIQPGLVARDLRWPRERAYAAWRKAKGLVRREMEDLEP